MSENKKKMKMDPKDDISNEDDSSQHDMDESSSGSTNSGNKPSQSIEIMERGHDDAMDIDHDDGSSDNIINGQANQANNRKEKINLLEMPKELLECILANLDDENMLKASHVCKTFASVVETVFAREYSNRYVIGLGVRKKPYQKVILSKYGGQIRRITVYRVDEEILDLIEQHCHSLERAELDYVPKMIRLENLKKISLFGVDNLDRGAFANLISHNQQLESLALGEPVVNLIELLDGRLNSLKKLRYHFDAGLITHLPKIRLNSLETLKLMPTPDNGPYVRFLPAFECNQLKHLSLESWPGPEEYDEGNDEVIEAICAFKTLEVLKMPFFPVTTDLLDEMAAHLPSLTELSITTPEKEPNQIVDYVSTVLSIFPKLSKLSIHLGDAEDDLERFTSDVKAAGIDFHHGRFAGTNTEIKIANQVDDDMVFTSKDFAYVRMRNSLELHWMANLNEKNVRGEIAKYPIRNLKFINHCAENTLDICAFLTVYDTLECLDIKSDGPITFKANSSRHHNFFPKLKILKIHVDEGNAIDFLQKLDSVFCERIQELWLDTKARNQELEHTHDMTNIFAKFKNLTSLNLVPEFAIYDTKHVWSVCRKLKSLNVRRQY